MTEASQPRRRGRPPNPDATSSTERNQRMRERRAEAGGRRLDVYLPPDAAAALDALCADNAATQSEMVTRLILRASGQPA